jgi:hypothetical protein
MSSFSEVIDYLSESHFNKNISIERKAFASHLTKVLIALRIIESVDLGYALPGQELSAIDDCIYDFENQERIENE